MNLYTAGQRRGVVAAPHTAAVEDGRAILAEGGNAIEAMLAMAASIAAVYPHMNHIGGDGFWLIREPSGRVRAIMGAGRAGSRATLQLYRDAGHHEIPARGPLAALTVPGAIAAWKLAGEAAKAQGGKLPLDVLLAGAIKHAREGYTVTRSQARLTVEKYAELETAPGFLQAFLIDGKPPEAGARLKQSKFADTLDQLSQAGLDDFYRGDVGREIAVDLERIGSPVTRADLEKFEAVVAEPLSVRDPGRHALQHAAADAGAGFAHDSWRCSTACAFRRRRASSTSTVSSKRPSAPSACATASSPIPTRSPLISANFCRRHFSTPKPRRSTPRKPRAGRRRTAKATPSGWARRIRPASSFPTSSRSIGNSAPASCCPRPAC